MHKVTQINYKDRISKVKAKLGPHAMLLIAQPHTIRNRDVENYYRQESFLHYMCGFEEPDSALLIVPNKPHGEQVHVFLRPKDPLAEQWDGRRLGVEDAVTELAVDCAHPIADLWTLLPKLLHGHEGVYYQLGMDAQADFQLIECLKKTRRMKPRFVEHLLPILDSEALAGEIRLYKSPAEIERMRIAASITAKAFKRVYKEVKPGMNEKQVYALLLSEFLYHGADMEAYPAIVAGGGNACILHYIENNQELKDGDLLLIDAGCQFAYYASDVTRTFPIGRTFSSAQKELYEVVLEAQRQSVELAEPGSSLAKVHEKSRDILIDGLIDLGILKGTKSKIIESNAYKKYYPHGTSHWIGMDVHDVGPYKGDDNQPLGRALEPGMCFTVEPGLYIPKDDQDAPERFRGIGIRIEDDVLITDQKSENLTVEIPKSVAELENRW